MYQSIHHTVNIFIVIPLTVSLAGFDVILPPSLLIVQLYVVLLSDDLTSGITRVLVFIPVTLLGNDPDPIVH